jgi:hypothetical protein
MEKELKDLPLSMVTLIFGGASIPLAFARQLVSLALVLAVLALLFTLWGRTRYKAHLISYTRHSVRRMERGARLALVGAACAVVMWVLWRTNVLLG